MMPLAGVLPETDRKTTLAALGLGLLAGLIYLWVFGLGEPPYGNLDPGYYQQMASKPIPRSIAMYAIRPLIPLAVYLTGLPVVYGFALVNILSLSALCATVERIGKALNGSKPSRLAACIMVCVSFPVGNSFWVKTLIDIPVMLFVALVALSALHDRITTAVVLACSLSLTHPLGFLIALGILAIKSRKKALLAAGIGTSLAVLWLVVFREYIDWQGPSTFLGFFRQGEQPIRSIIAQLMYGVGALPMAFLFAPRVYRKILLGASGGLLLGLLAGAWGARTVGYICPLLAPGALLQPSGPSRFNFRSGLLLVLATAATCALFLLQLREESWTTGDKRIGIPALILSVVFLVLHRNSRSEASPDHS
jgi:hypothetical protein